MMNMDLQKHASPFSQAERDALFEKIFRELRIAPVSSSHVEEVCLHETRWYRRAIDYAFANFDCVCYAIGRFIIVFNAHSEQPIFAVEHEQDFDVFSDQGLDFWLKKHTGYSFYFERYVWTKSEALYYVETYPEETVPDNFVQAPKNDVAPKDHQWIKMYPHEDIETKSVDNSVFYGFIVKYWE